MIFKCDKNKFLAQMINMRKLPLETYTYSTGKRTIILTNHDIIETFLKEMSPKELINIQNILAVDKYSVKAINNLAKSAGNLIAKRESYL